MIGFALESPYFVESLKQRQSSSELLDSLIQEYAVSEVRTISALLM